MTANRDIITHYEKVLKSGGTIEKEIRDYILCTKVYQCTPSELDDVEESVLQLHFSLYNAENKHQFLEGKREEQKRLLNKR